MTGGVEDCAPALGGKACLARGLGVVGSASRSLTIPLVINIFVGVSNDNPRGFRAGVLFHLHRYRKALCKLCPRIRLARERERFAIFSQNVVPKAFVVAMLEFEHGAPTVG
jgi:hypothetical protein